MSRITYADITIERLYPSGGYECYTLVGNFFEQKSYYGYTKREALRDFHAYINAL